MGRVIMDNTDTYLAEPGERGTNPRGGDGYSGGGGYNCYCDGGSDGSDGEGGSDGGKGSGIDVSSFPFQYFVIQPGMGGSASGSGYYGGGGGGVLINQNGPQHNHYQGEGYGGGGGYPGNGLNGAVIIEKN